VTVAEFGESRIFSSRSTAKLFLKFGNASDNC